mmetsp:Transcript_14120/g.28190  ORF Transcript_14120/g.28190 Transcript_14120/m.28190 type:complete len:103 (-) Transcript_14120:1810-2118(-)
MIGEVDILFSTAVPIAVKAEPAPVAGDPTPPAAKGSADPAPVPALSGLTLTSTSPGGDLTGGPRGFAAAAPPAAGAEVGGGEGRAAAAVETAEWGSVELVEC